PPPSVLEVAAEEFTDVLAPEEAADISAAFALCATQKAHAAVAIPIIALVKIILVLLLIFSSCKTNSSKIISD
ncbi:hypothetical protein HMPREF1574_00886, partial [Gardnerella pickettii JCP7659]